MKYAMFLLIVIGISSPLYSAEPKKRLADILTYDVARLITLEKFQELSDAIKSNKEPMGRSRYIWNQYRGCYSGGKTALHELLLKFPVEEENDHAFANVRSALVTTLLNRLTSEQAHDMIQEKTVTSKATARDIIAFYGSDETAQYQYVKGEQEKLLKLLAQYDQSALAKNIDEKD